MVSAGKLEGAPSREECLSCTDLACSPFFDLPLAPAAVERMDVRMCTMPCAVPALAERTTLEVLMCAPQFLIRGVPPTPQPPSLLAGRPFLSLLFATAAAPCARFPSSRAYPYPYAYHPYSELC